MIKVTDLAYNAGDFQLGNLSFEIVEGEYFVLLGKPGSGKSIFLECLCGLNRVSSGKIEIAGQDVTLAEPRDRFIGYVPQDYALFPTKLVYDNIAFGLKVQSLPREEIAGRLDNITDLLNIKSLLNRSIHGLSGGEQQKVALARALIIRPKVLLLDEPVSALDEATRETVCMELKRIQQETGTTTVHVCHNFEETRIVADRVGILRNGQLVQVGTPDEVFEHPVDIDIAKFLRVGNILSGHTEVNGKQISIIVGDIKLKADDLTHQPSRVVDIALPVRNIFVSSECPDNSFENILTGNIIGIHPRGLVTHIIVKISDKLSLTALIPPYFGEAAAGANVYLSFPASAIHIFN